MNLKNDSNDEDRNILIRYCETIDTFLLLAQDYVATQ